MSTADGILLGIGDTIIPPRKFVTDIMSVTNSTRILAYENMGGKYPIIYYGDTITLDQRDKLEIPLGSYSSGTILSVQAGYRYEYYIVEHKFIVTDPSNNKNIRYGVYTWGDMNIDFSIYESGQFLMIITGDYGVSSGMFIVVDRVLYMVPVSVEEYTWGQFDPYIKSQLHWFLPNGVVIEDYSTTDIVLNVAYDILELYYSLINDVYRLKYSYNFPKQNTIPMEMFPIKKIIKDPAYEVVVDENVLMAIVSNLLVSMLLPIQNPSEHYNNLPVYEPWMIMLIMKLFVFETEGGDIPHPRDDDKDNNPYVFSLSPNWG